MAESVAKKTTTVIIYPPCEFIYMTYKVPTNACVYQDGSNILCLTTRKIT